MLIYRGRQYTALSPDQKAKKKQYLLEQSQLSDKIPTFDEVLAYYKDDYDMDPDDPEHFGTWDEFVDNMQHEYNEAIKRVSWGTLDGDDCWRIMGLPTGLDPISHTGLGIFWAYNEEGPEDAWGGGSPGEQHVVYRAKIDLSHVNKGATVHANCAPGQGEYEYEVQFYQHAPIYVYDVTRANGIVEEIEDYRRC